MSGKLEKKYYRDGLSDAKREYKLNQYEDYSKKKFIVQKCVEARYIDQEYKGDVGNPLIEALPPFYEMKDVVRILLENPEYNPEDRKKKDAIRARLIEQLKELFFVFQTHIYCETRLAKAIRNGYSKKYLIAPEFLKNVMESDANERSEIQVKNKNCSGQSLGITIVGISGGGKSVGISNILAMYPQCIIHNNYNGHKFLFKQLTYIKVDSPHDGSIKGLCMGFFSQVDKVIGTKYYEKFGNRRNSIDSMIIKMKKVVELHALGALVIDEIQHLEGAKGGPDKVMNFLTTLENELHLPLIFIGTYKAMNNVLAGDFRLARRTVGKGMILWDRLEKGKQWDDFIRFVWQYQWTKIETPLTREFSDLFYKLTAGIISRVIDLYLAIQEEAILLGTEEITIDLIEYVNDFKMRATKSMIEAVIKDDKVELSKYPDINPTNISYKNNIDEKRDKEIQSYVESEEYRELYEENSIKMKLMKIIIGLGIANLNQADKIVQEIIDEHGIKKEFNFLEKKLGKKIMEMNKKTDKKTSEKSSVRKKMSTEEVYKEYEEKGILKNPEDDF